MSEQIDEIITKHEESFLGKEKEIKAFLLKHFEKAFKEHLVERFERIDATDRIKTAGFQKQLSTWRNIYKNIVVTSCIIINKEKKRYDYKFYFIEEKLDDKTIEIIEEVLKEVNSLKRNFSFDEALEKVDELLEMIKLEEDKVYNKRLFDIKKEILASKNEHAKLKEDLSKLENDIKHHQDVNDLELITSSSQEILGITSKLRNAKLTKHYKAILEDAQKEIDIRKELAKLIKAFEFNLKKLNIDNAITISEDILFIAKVNNKDEIFNEYINILKELDKSLSEIRDNVYETIEEAKKHGKESRFEKALQLIDNILRDIQAHQFLAFKELEKDLQKTRQDLLDKQEKHLNFSSNFIELNQKLISNLKNNQLFTALHICERLIEISKDNKRKDFIEKYEQTRELINTRIEKLKKKIDGLIERSSELSNNLQFETALSELESMIRYLGQELPEYKEKLKTKRKEVIKKEEEYRALEAEIQDLDNELLEFLNKNDYVSALGTCEKILKVEGLSKNPELIEKYNKTLEEIKDKIVYLKNSIEQLIKESLALKDEHKFKEALSNLEDLMQLIGDQDLKEEKRKILKARSEILEEQQNFVQFSDDMTELDKQLKDHLKKKHLMDALNTSDLLIQISESFNKPELIEKYSEIFKEIDQKINEIKQKIEDTLKDTSALIKNHQYKDATSNIDTLLKLVKTQGLEEYESKLEEKKKEIAETEKEYKKFQKELLDIDTQLNLTLSQKDLSNALDHAQELLKLSEAQGNEELIAKYKKILDDINGKIEGIQFKIEDAMDSSLTHDDVLEFEGSLSELDDLISLVNEFNLPDFKKRLEERRTELIEAQQAYIPSDEAGKKVSKGKPKDCPEIVSNLSLTIEGVVMDLKQQITDVQAKLFLLQEAEQERLKKEKELKPVFKPQIAVKKEDNQEVIKILEDFLLTLVNQFGDIRDKISKNLKKLHLGIIHQTTVRVIDQIFKDELKKYMENFQLKINKVKTTIMKEPSGSKNKKV